MNTVGTTYRGVALSNARGARRFAAAAALVTVVLIGATACDSENANPHATSNPATTSPASAVQVPSGTARATPTAWPRIGDDVHDGALAFVVTSISGSRYAGDPDNEHLQTRAQGLYLMFDVRVTNTSSSPQIFYAANQTLNLPGRVFAVDSRAAALADSARVPINPGNTATVKLAFDCPPDVVWRDESGYRTSATALVLRDTGQSSGVAVDIQYVGDDK